MSDNIAIAPTCCRAGPRRLQEAVARRARVQCERFGWMGGMLMEMAPDVRQRLGEPDEKRPGRWWLSGWECSEVLPPEALPVPDDPATIGCFAAMARKATGRPLYVVPTIDGDGWQVCAPASFGANEPVETAVGGSWEHASEIEAWLAVLEATP